MSEKQKNLKQIQKVINMMRSVNRQNPSEERAKYILLAHNLQDLLRDGVKLPDSTLVSFYDYTQMLVAEGREA